MDFFMGYLLGIAVAVVTIIAQHSPTTMQDIEAAQHACVENKGLKEMNAGTVSCNNGATFELEKLK